MRRPDTPAKHYGAKFYDQESGQYVVITTDTYDPEIHEGRIMCAEDDCCASLKYTGPSVANGNNDYRAAFFSTNPYGEPHKENCPRDPDPQVRKTVGMLEALEDGRFIVLNLNFTTSFDRAKGTIKDAFKAAADMKRVGGFARKQWNDQHPEDRRATYPVRSFDVLASVLHTFNRVRKDASTGEIGPDRLLVSHLHGIVPWSRFYMTDPQKAVGEKPFTPSAAVTSLTEQWARKDSNLWHPMPALRMGRHLLRTETLGQRAGLLTAYQQNASRVQVDGQWLPVQDVLVVNALGIREELVAHRGAIDVVATPYIKGSQIKRAIERKDPIHLHWPITNTAQFRLIKT